MSYWLAWPFVAFRGSARLAQLAVLVAAALALLSTCILPPEPSSQEVLIEFEVPADTVRLAVGGEVRPTVTVRADGNVLATVRLQFESADPTVVAVDSTGSLRAIRRGVTSVRIVLLSGSAGVSPPDTTFPVRVIVLGMRVASAVETLTALGDTLPFRPG